MKCLATFDTTHMALSFEKSCRKAGFAVKIIPVPRSVSASCGFACSYACDDEHEIKKIVEEQDIEVSAYHKIED